MCNRGIGFIAQTGDTRFLEMHQQGLKKAELKIKEMLAHGDVTQAQVDAAMKKARLKDNATETEKAAVLQAWAKENPGKPTMEWGRSASLTKWPPHHHRHRPQTPLTSARAGGATRAGASSFS